MAKLSSAKPTIVKLTMVILLMVNFNFNWFLYVVKPKLISM
jgi:hypothetical protein